MLRRDNGSGRLEYALLIALLVLGCAAGRHHCGFSLRRYYHRPGYYVSHTIKEP